MVIGAPIQWGDVPAWIGAATGIAGLFRGFGQPPGGPVPGLGRDAGGADRPGAGGAAPLLAAVAAAEADRASWPGALLMT